MPEPAARPARPPVDLAPDGTGAGLVRAAWGGTAVHAVAAAAAVATTAGRGPHTVVALVLFVAGAAVGMAGFLRAVGRSREELVDVAGLFLFLGSMPRRTQLVLWAAVAAQVAVGVAAGSLRIYTSTATSILAPLWAYGVAVLWNGRHGAFPPRPARADRSGRPARP